MQLGEDQEPLEEDQEPLEAKFIDKEGNSLPSLSNQIIIRRNEKWLKKQNYMGPMVLI
ncbi:hypothetical protein [Clostridium thailandense]|uniref:hypothetical protein n=1 Tax=Clostridium thailandense TaxID=2794346 RepID=UPI0039896D2D